MRRKRNIWALGRRIHNSSGGPSEASVSAATQASRYALARSLDVRPEGPFFSGPGPPAIPDGPIFPGKEMGSPSRNPKQSVPKGSLKSPLTEGGGERQED